MGKLEFKRNKKNYEINLFESENSSSYYRNIVDRNPLKIAQILIDLYLYGYPIDKAVKIFLKRVKTSDWLGL